MKSQIDNVVEFNKLNNTPQNIESLKLYIKLIKEETEEIEEAIESGNLEGQLDGFVDLLYVTLGGAYSAKLEDVIEEAFERVHTSNMTKFCDSIRDANATVNLYAEKGISTYVAKVLDYYVVRRSVDNKILKNHRWVAAHLKDLVLGK